MDTTIVSSASELDSLPLIPRSERNRVIADGGAPLKRFVVFALEGKTLIASRGYRFRWRAERSAHSLRFYGITGGTVVIDQEDYEGSIYRDDAMIFEDFLDFMGDELDLVKEL